MTERTLSKKEIEARRVRIEKKRLLQRKNIHDALQTLSSYSIVRQVYQDGEIYIEPAPEWKYEKPM